MLRLGLTLASGRNISFILNPGVQGRRGVHTASGGLHTASVAEENKLHIEGVGSAGDPDGISQSRDSKS